MLIACSWKYPPTVTMSNRKAIGNAAATAMLCPGPAPERRPQQRGEEHQPQVGDDVPEHGVVGPCPGMVADRWRPGGEDRTRPALPSRAGRRGRHAEPVTSSSVTATAAKPHSGGSSRRSRRRTALIPVRSTEPAISDPARANIRPIAGNKHGSARSSPGCGTSPPGPAPRPTTGPGSGHGPSADDGGASPSVTDPAATVVSGDAVIVPLPATGAVPETVRAPQFLPDKPEHSLTASVRWFAPPRTRSAGTRR